MSIRDDLQQLRGKIETTWQMLKLDALRQRIFDLEAVMQEEDFWKNAEAAKAVSQETSTLKNEVATWETIKKEVDETLDIARMAEKEHDAALQSDIEQKVHELQKRFAELEFFILLSGEYDERDAIVVIHSGAGGVDAQDWAEMLLRMITRFAETQGWRVDMLDKSMGQEAGIKSVMLEVRGRYAYGKLKSEHGVHRLVRISPFDAESMRHTSFAMIEVIPDLGDIVDVELNDEDLRIDVFRSGGHGGQSVNTTDSAVRVVHLPTGITVTCQNEKSQHQNKATAFNILKSKLHQLTLAKQEEEKQKLRGEFTSAAWGNQIRSYVLHPYKLVKDHRTDFEVTNPDVVLNGDLAPFIESYLKWRAEQERA